MRDETQARSGTMETVEVEFSDTLVTELLVRHVRSTRGHGEVGDGPASVRWDVGGAAPTLTLRYQRGSGS